MKQRIFGIVQRTARRSGWDLVKVQAEGEAPLPIDFDADAVALVAKVRPHTLTSPERIVTLRDAVRHIVERGVEGDIVECGVWKGGSMLVIVDTLLSLGVRDRDLHLFDTFTTMPPPTAEDIDAWGVDVAEYYDAAIAEPFYNYEQDEVRKLLEATGYPKERLHFVKGMVEDTIPQHAPAAIALCRLDTDFYSSTAHEMQHLVPRIPEGGVLIIDDYGHFDGARKAVDEYFAEHDVPVLLNRIDYSGRLVVIDGAVRRAIGAS